MKNSSKCNTKKSFSALTKTELVKINGGGIISDAFWYVVGYWAGSAKRAADSPTGVLMPNMY